MPIRTYPALLAVAATVTAACLSIMAGWQRGGFVAERALWVAVGVVIVIAAHLLPALCRPHGWSVRAAGAVLWIGCMAATCYGHAIFFLTAQKHAGELRTAAVPVVTDHGRDLGAIAADRASAVTRLARANSRRCVERCPALRIERTTLAAKLEALDAEAAEAKRTEAAQDRAAAARDAALADPVTNAMTAFGVAPARLEVVTGLAFAVVLEAIACFCWLLALRPADDAGIAVTPVQQGSHATQVTQVTAPSHSVVTRDAPHDVVALAAESPAPEHPDELARVMAEIAAGRLRATVNEIRRFLGCSQARAAAVRRQLEPLSPQRS